METKQKTIIPLQQEVLRNHISETLREFSVLQLHVSHVENASSADVLILVKDSKEAETLRARNWINKAAATQVNVHISSYPRAEFHLKCGNPFYQYYADPATMVWRNEDLGLPLKTYPTKKAFKKKLNVFKEKFYHDHDILRTEAHRFHSARMYAASFRTCLSLYEHHVEYLENLYTGHNLFHTDLHTRLQKLIRYIPEIQKVFVLKNKQTFYLLSKMEESVREAQDGGESDRYSELFGAVKAAEEHLYTMVAARFSKFRNMIRFRKSSPVINDPAENSPVDPLFENVLKILLTKLAPEEIYLFHTKETGSPNPEEIHRIYYLLVIGDGIGNSAIQDIQNSVSDTSTGRAKIVILAHSRIYLQNHLSKHQHVMQRIITAKNKVYESHAFHPPIHWQDEVGESDWEFDMQYRTMKGFAAQYFNLRDHLQHDNHYGLVQLFSHSLMHLLRLYVCAALPSYRPHYLNTFSIWKLGVYADPSLEKIEFLFEKVSADFYKLIDYYIKYSDRSGMASDEELVIMDEILSLLLEKLDNLLKAKNIPAKIP